MALDEDVLLAAELAREFRDKALLVPTRVGGVALACALADFVNAQADGGGRAVLLGMMIEIAKDRAKCNAG